MTQDWNKSSEEDVQMPLGVGGDSEAEFTGGGDSKPKVNGPTVILFAAFAAGLLVIYLLGMQSKPRKASAEQLAHDAQVKSAIADLLAKNGKADQLDSLFRDTDKLMKMFHAYFGGEGRQAPALEHDPFANDDAKPDPGRDASILVDRGGAEAAKLKTVADLFATLKLQSVFLSKNPIAMVNNRMLTIGAKYGELTVSKIEASRVVFKFDDKEFQLKLSQPNVDQ